MLNRAQRSLPTLRKPHTFGNEQCQEVSGLRVACLSRDVESLQAFAGVFTPMNQEMLSQCCDGGDVAARGGVAKKIGRLSRAVLGFESARGAQLCVDRICLVHQTILCPRLLKGHAQIGAIQYGRRHGNAVWTVGHGRFENGRR